MMRTTSRLKCKMQELYKKINCLSSMSISSTVVLGSFVLFYRYIEYAFI